MNIGERPTRWEIAAADRADQLQLAQVRIAHLERLITDFATADADWFRVTGDVTSRRAERLHGAEMALRAEAEKIAARAHLSA